jgi:hypothetical protein
MVAYRSYSRVVVLCYNSWGVCWTVATNSRSNDCSLPSWLCSRFACKRSLINCKSYVCQHKVIQPDSLFNWYLVLLIRYSYVIMPTCKANNRYPSSLFPVIRPDHDLLWVVTSNMHVCHSMEQIISLLPATPNMCTTNSYYGKLQI